MKTGNPQSPPHAGAAPARCQRLTLSLPADVASAVDALAARKRAASRSALVADLLRAATTDAAASAANSATPSSITTGPSAPAARGAAGRLTPAPPP